MENPEALAGATGADPIGAHASAECHPQHACDIRSSALSDLASVPELRAYALACYTRMPPKAQAAFLNHVRGVQ